LPKGLENTTQTYKKRLKPTTTPKTIKVITMNHYVTINHPNRIGENLVAIPTGKVRQRESTLSEVEAEVRILTPKSNLDKLWIVKEDIITT